MTSCRSQQAGLLPEAQQEPVERKFMTRQQQQTIQLDNLDIIPRVKLNTAELYPTRLLSHKLPITQLFQLQIWAQARRSRQMRPSRSFSGMSSSKCGISLQGFPVLFPEPVTQCTDRNSENPVQFSQELIDSLQASSEVWTITIRWESSN